MLLVMPPKKLPSEKVISSSQMEVGANGNCEDSIAEMKERIKNIIDSFATLPCGPIYENMNKLLAELYLKSNDEQACIFHLLESHGATFRIQTCSRISSNIKKSKKCGPSVELNREFLSFHGPLQSKLGVLHRLKELPSEWSIVQMTLEFDPFSRSSSLKSNRALGLYITHLPCGSDKSINSRKNALPFTVYVPPLIKGEKSPSLVIAMKEIVDKLNNKALRPSSSDFYTDCSLGIEGIVHEVNEWLHDWGFLISGRLFDSKLEQSIQTAVDKLVASYISYSSQLVNVKLHSDDSSPKLSSGKSQALPYRSYQILYLLASAMHVGFSQSLNVVSSLIDDTAFCSYVAKGIINITKTFSSRLAIARRHPVILILDDELDLIPFEMTATLKGHPVTRIPNIHILSALYDYHRDKILMTGINTQKGYYVINPANDIQSLEKDLMPMLKQCVPTWEGCVGVKPSPEQFLCALEERDVFMYCGHGGGNQFIHAEDIEKKHVKAVVILIGCSSVKVMELGGRVSMHSLFSSYFMAGCPAIVGNLWNVLDYDANCITRSIIELWCPYNNPTAIDTLAEEIHSKLTLQSAEPCVGLLDAIAKSKLRRHRYYFNSAALVVRGLPLVASLRKTDP